MNVLNPPKFVTRGVIGAMGLSAIAFFGVTESANALTVVKGSDYWITGAGSEFDFGGPIGLVEFVGRPIGDWTPPEGGDPIDVGKADTIVRRLDDVTFNTDAQDGEFGDSDVEVVALSLMSKNSVDLNGSSYNILVNLNSEGESTGTITINEDKTFSSNFRVYWLPTFRPVDGGDDRSCTELLGDINCDSFFVDLSATTGDWSSIFPGGTRVEGLVGDMNANVHTDLSSTQTDFFPGAKELDDGKVTVSLVKHDASGAGHHNVEPVPEPLTILGSFTALGFGTFFKRKVGKKSQQDKA